MKTRTLWKAWLALIGAALLSALAVAPSAAALPSASSATSTESLTVTSPSVLALRWVYSGESFFWRSDCEERGQYLVNRGEALSHYCSGGLLTNYELWLHQ